MSTRRWMRRSRKWGLRRRITWFGVSWVCTMDRAEWIIQYWEWGWRMCCKRTKCWLKGWISSSRDWRSGLTSGNELIKKRNIKSRERRYGGRSVKSAVGGQLISCHFSFDCASIQCHFSEGCLCYFLPVNYRKDTHQEDNGEREHRTS